MGNAMKDKFTITLSQLDYLAEKIAEIVCSFLTNQTLDKVLTKKQVAQLLDKSTDAIDKMCERGQLPFHTKGKHRYFSLKEINDYFLNR